MTANNQEYKIKFVDDFIQIKEWYDSGDKFWERKLKEYPEQLAICQKYKGKTIKLSEIPNFIKEVGECIIDEEYITVYNGYNE